MCISFSVAFAYVTNCFWRRTWYSVPRSNLCARRWRKNSGSPSAAGRRDSVPLCGGSAPSVFRGPRTSPAPWTSRKRTVSCRCSRCASRRSTSTAAEQTPSKGPRRPAALPPPPTTMCRSCATWARVHQQACTRPPHLQSSRTLCVVPFTMHLGRRHLETSGVAAAPPSASTGPQSN